MQTKYDIINETLNNLNQRQVQGLAACDLIAYVAKQLAAIYNICKDEEKEKGEQPNDHPGE